MGSSTMMSHLLNYWKVFVFIVVPIMFSPVLFLWEPVEGDNIPKVTYTILVMAAYWISEVIPLSVTALIPLVAFPVLMVTTAKKVATQYLSDGTWLFSGGLMVAVAVEEVNLHRRIALNVLNITGSVPGRLMAGIMISSALLSSFISNTATTAMMLPVVMSLASEIIAAKRLAASLSDDQTKHMLNAENGRSGYSDDNESYKSDHSLSPVRRKTTTVHMVPQNLTKSEHSMTKALLLAVSYSASLGGTATLTGSLPNIVMKGVLDKAYGSDQPINYATWSFFNVPGALLNLVMAWFWLQLLYFGFRRMFDAFRPEKSGVASRNVTRVIREEIKELGPITFAEVSLLVWYLVALTLWLTRELTGWYLLFTDGDTKYISDTAAIMLVVIILFIWPRELGSTYRPMLTWNAVEKKFPWGVILLLGGGYAIAGAASSSGLSQMIATQLSHLNVSNLWLCVISVVLMTYLTEFTSNTATSQIVLPIVLSLSEKRCFNPLYLALPVAQAASFAFMLPVATPPNAIIFSSGMLKVIDMIIAGSLMNILAIIEVLFGVHTWGNAMFDFYEMKDGSLFYKFPEWAAPHDNYTCIPTVGL